MTYNLVQVIFYVFAAVAILASCFVVISNNPVRSALALVLVFFASAGIWILYQVEFLALILVLVYVGAVMTLFLFLVMMIDFERYSIKRHFFFYAPVTLLVVAVLVSLVILSLPESLSFKSSLSEAEKALPNATALGMVLYTDYVYAFELAAVLLLIAIVAAIGLANRDKGDSLRQNVLKQVVTRKQDRLKILKMAPVKDDD